MFGLFKKKEKQKKVYCVECKYFLFGNLIDLCEHPQYLTTQDKYDNQKTYLGVCSVLNSNNKCKTFSSKVQASVNLFKLEGEHGKKEKESGEEIENERSGC